MSVMETLNTRRTYRRFAQKPVPQDVVADLQTNDIIIVGHGSEADGVFRIVNILRDFGGVSCMELSYKGIAHTDTPDKPETPDNPELNPDESDS